MARGGTPTSTWQAQAGQRERDEPVASQRVQEMRLVRCKGQSEAERKSLQDLFEFIGGQSSSTTVQWIEEEEVLWAAQCQLTKGSLLAVAQGCVYVMWPFGGAAFDVLKESKVPIYSPNCVLTSIRQGFSLPRHLGSAIFSFALLRVNVCCSNMMAEAREEVYRMVQEMAGTTNKALTACCTHLITPVVGSVKYFAATEAGMRVMMPAWVGAVYKLAKAGQDNADNLQQLSAKFATPIFAGCFVSVSQLSQEQRAQIRALMKEHGGRYDKDLSKATVTHLICDVLVGDKCVAAASWKIPIVHSQWVRHSVDKGYCLDYRKYLLTGPKSAAANLTADQRVSGSSASSASQRALTPDHVRQGPNGLRATSTPHKNAQRLDVELDISAIDKPVKTEDGAAAAAAAVPTKKEEEAGDSSGPQAKQAAVAHPAKNEGAVQSVVNENDLSSSAAFPPPSPQPFRSSPQARPSVVVAAGTITSSVAGLRVEAEEVKAEVLEKVEGSAGAPCSSLLLARRVMALVGQENNRSGPTWAMPTSAKSSPANSPSSAVPVADTFKTAPTGSKEVAQLRVQQEMAQLRQQLQMAKVTISGQAGPKMGRLTRRPSNKGKKSPGRKDRGQVVWSQHERQPFLAGEGGRDFKDDGGQSEEEYEEGSEDEVAEVAVVVAAAAANGQPLVKPPPTSTNSIVPLLRQAPAVGPLNSKRVANAVEGPAVSRPKRPADIVEVEQGQAAADKVFILSGIPADGEKQQIFDAITKLGGRFIDTIQLQPQATHLLVKAPAKNEKFYGCCATGRFILHPSYIIHSAKAGHYLPEEEYEWGNVDKAAHLLLDLDDNNMKLAKAAHRWRLHVSRGHPPAFTGWTVIVLAEQAVRGDGYIRMLKAGGATVLPNTPPLLQYVKRATHLLYESGKVAISREEVEAFEAAGVICNRPEMLSQYITDQTPPIIPPHLRHASHALPPPKRSRP
ncbi:DNA topoisomerase 2-binding protein 1 [Ramazzottius varieornatus]|uniref:DNA topoisomerase 2-binding protein 1 n=1 Tax=Ramazzottius varieornatus TaxID=947166 RepID=A0A1D1W7K9_RAMVA|nr:DNA topoisomerase 2-binding protein 1 [Ramazzottius varieornatus]